jgi:hypothetical protein
MEDEPLVCSDKTLTLSSNLYYYAQKQVQLLSLLSVIKCTVFLQFLNKDSTAIVFYLFSSALIISGAGRA